MNSRHSYLAMPASDRSSADHDIPATVVFVDVVSMRELQNSLDNAGEFTDHRHVMCAGKKPTVGAKGAHQETGIGALGHADENTVKRVSEIEREVHCRRHPTHFRRAIAPKLRNFSQADIGCLVDRGFGDAAHSDHWLIAITGRYGR